MRYCFEMEPSLAVGSVGEGAWSVGVGGVTRVVGASCKFGGVAGRRDDSPGVEVIRAVGTDFRE